MAASKLARNVWEALGSWTLRREPDPKQSSQIRLMPLNVSAKSKMCFLVKAAGLERWMKPGHRKGFFAVLMNHVLLDLKL